MTDVAPDLIEPVEAWRVWRAVEVDAAIRLASAVWPTVWPVGEALTAACLRRRPLRSWFARRPQHDAPQFDCLCGIYGTSLNHVEPYLNAPSLWQGLGGVVGRVSLWGWVVECERGLRASHAYPLELYVPAEPVRRGARWHELSAGLTGYGVRVELLPSRARDAAELLASF